MAVYEFRLTEAEVACGVTAADVAKAAADAHTAFDDIAVMRASTPPAIATAAARFLLNADSVKFAGINGYGHPLYRRA